MKNIGDLLLVMGKEDVRREEDTASIWSMGGIILIVGAIFCFMVLVTVIIIP